MTTSRSPLRILKSQADRIAQSIKAIERGENVTDDFSGKIAAARNRDGIKFGVVMDDKTLVVEMTWATIKATSEVGIAEYILKQIRGARETQH
jgi:hypothetical protein